MLQERELRLYMTMFARKRFHASQLKVLLGFLSQLTEKLGALSEIPVNI